MACSRAAASSSCHSRMRIPPRRPPQTISVYVLLLLAFSAILFLFSQRQIADVDQKNLHEERLQDEEKQLFQKERVKEEQLWGSSLGFDFQPCVEPTSKYQAPQDWGRYLTVRSNGGLNQMRTG